MSLSRPTWMLLPVKVRLLTIMAGSVELSIMMPIDCTGVKAECWLVCLLCRLSDPPATAMSLLTVVVLMSWTALLSVVVPT